MNAGGVAVVLAVLILMAGVFLVFFLEEESGIEVAHVEKQHTVVRTPSAKPVEPLEDFSFPSDHDNSTVVIAFQNTSGMREVAGHFFNGGTCKAMRGVDDESLESFNTHSTLIDVQYSCLELFKHSDLGTGNYLSAFYGIRMAAHSLGDKVDVSILCDDAAVTKYDLITPWVMGRFPRLPPNDPERQDLPSIEEACRDYKSVPIGYRWRDMVFEMRRMAIAMMGIPSPNHPAAAWAEENLWKHPEEPYRHGRDYFQLPHPQKGDTPLFPGTELDDAVIHFRCGDIIMTNHPSFGFMKFSSFSRHISPEARRIGIVTQPFEKGGLQRQGDSGSEKQKRCKVVVYAFIDHLRERFPDATVSLWNSLEETIPQTFARMIMANQTIIGITSFGVFPGVTTFGTGYIRYPDYPKAPNRWLLTSPVVEKAGNVELIKEPILFATQAKKKWGEDGSELLEWFNADVDPPKEPEGNQGDVSGIKDAPINLASPTSEGIMEVPDEFLLPSELDASTVVVSIQNNTGENGMLDFGLSFFKSGMCRAVGLDDLKESLEKYNTHSTLVDIQFGCMDLFKKSAIGTGNYISAFYGIRLTAHALGPKTDVSIYCKDAEETKYELILPWLTGKFPRLPADDPERAELPAVDYSCLRIPIGYRWRDMRFDLRRMAIAMMGIPSPDHPAAAWAEENLWSNLKDSHRHGRDYFQLPHPQKGDTPLFPGTELDDAVIHFRCGDIIISNHPSFGFMKFASFSRHVSPEARRIGIVTQPFETGGLLRRSDASAEKRRRCKVVVHSFIDHLQKRFPDATINVWNSADETIPQTFARMIMANQTIIGITSFGVFPGVTTFGRGYIRKPDYRKAPNTWLLSSSIENRTDNVELIKEPILFAGEAQKKWGDDGSELLKWFDTYDDVGGT